MTTTLVIAAACIFIAGLFAVIVERTEERDEARAELARANREHEAEANILATCVREAAAENAELDQENMRLHSELTEAQLLAGTVRIPHLRAVPTQRDEWPAIVRAVEGES